VRITFAAVVVLVRIAAVGLPEAMIAVAHGERKLRPRIRFPPTITPVLCCRSSAVAAGSSEGLVPGTTAGAVTLRDPTRAPLAGSRRSTWPWTWRLIVFGKTDAIEFRKTRTRAHTSAASGVDGVVVDPLK
jgi:hypothetical protein